MTPEEMERAVNFIVEQQAQFSADIQQLKQVQIQLQDQQVTFQTQLGNLTATTLELAKLTSAVAQSQLNTDRKVEEMSNKAEQVSSELAETNERLNIFINVLERYLGGRNGNSES